MKCISIHPTALLSKSFEEPVTVFLACLVLRLVLEMQAGVPFYLESSTSHKLYQAVILKLCQKLFFCCFLFFKKASWGTLERISVGNLLDLTTGRSHGRLSKMICLLVQKLKLSWMHSGRILSTVNC